MPPARGSANTWWVMAVNQALDETAARDAKRTQAARQFGSFDYSIVMNDLARLFPTASNELIVAAAQAGLDPELYDLDSLASVVEREQTHADNPFEAALGAVRTASRWGFGEVQSIYDAGIPKVLRFGVNKFQGKGWAEAWDDAEGIDYFKQAMEAKAQGKEIAQGDGWFFQPQSAMQLPGFADAWQDRLLEYREGLVEGQPVNPEDMRRMFDETMADMPVDIAQAAQDQAHSTTWTKTWDGEEHEMPVSLGRLVFMNIFEPGTAPAQIASGIVDGSMQIGLDPLNPVFASAGKAIRTRRTAIPDRLAEVEMEAAHPRTFTPEEAQRIRAQIADEFERGFEKAPPWTQAAWQNVFDQVRQKMPDYLSMKGVDPDDIDAHRLVEEARVQWMDENADELREIYETVRTEQIASRPDMTTSTGAARHAAEDASSRRRWGVSAEDRQRYREAGIELNRRGWVRPTFVSDWMKSKSGKRVVGFIADSKSTRQIRGIVGDNLSQQDLFALRHTTSPQEVESVLARYLGVGELSQYPRLGLTNRVVGPNTPKGLNLRVLSQSEADELAIIGLRRQGVDHRYVHGRPVDPEVLAKIDEMDTKQLLTRESKLRTIDQAWADANRRARGSRIDRGTLEAGTSHSIFTPKNPLIRWVDKYFRSTTDGAKLVLDVSDQYKTMDQVDSWMRTLGAGEAAIDEVTNIIMLEGHTREGLQKVAMVLENNFTNWAKMRYGDDSEHVTSLLEQFRKTEIANHLFHTDRMGNPIFRPDDALATIVGPDGKPLVLPTLTAVQEAQFRAMKVVMPSVREIRMVTSNIRHSTDKLRTWSTRVFKREQNADVIKGLEKSWGMVMLDAYGAVWRNATLLRPSWVLRVGFDEFARILADGYGGMYTPSAFVAMAMHNPEMLDLIGRSLDDADTVMNQLGTGLRRNVRNERAGTPFDSSGMTWGPVLKGDANYYEALATQIIMSHTDELTRGLLELGHDDMLTWLMDTVEGVAVRNRIANEATPGSWLWKLSGERFKDVPDDIAYGLIREEVAKNLIDIQSKIATLAGGKYFYFDPNAGAWRDHMGAVMGVTSGNDLVRNPQMKQQIIQELTSQGKLQLDAAGRPRTPTGMMSNDELVNLWHQTKYGTENIPNFADLESSGRHMFVADEGDPRVRSFIQKGYDTEGAPTPANLDRWGPEWRKLAEDKEVPDGWWAYVQRKRDAVNDGEQIMVDPANLKKGSIADDLADDEVEAIWLIPDEQVDAARGEGIDLIDDVEPLSPEAGELEAVRAHYEEMIDVGLVGLRRTAADINLGRVLDEGDLPPFALLDGYHADNLDSLASWPAYRSMVTGDDLAPATELDYENIEAIYTRLLQALESGDQDVVVRIIDEYDEAVRNAMAGPPEPLPDLPAPQVSDDDYWAPIPEGADVVDDVEPISPDVQSGRDEATLRDLFAERVSEWKAWYGRLGNPKYRDEVREVASRVREELTQIINELDQYYPGFAGRMLGDDVNAGLEMWMSSPDRSAEWFLDYEMVAFKPEPLTRAQKRLESQRRRKMRQLEKDWEGLNAIPVSREGTKRYSKKHLVDNRPESIPEGAAAPPKGPRAPTSADKARMGWLDSENPQEPWLWLEPEPQLDTERYLAEHLEELYGGDTSKMPERVAGPRAEAVRARSWGEDVISGAFDLMGASVSRTLFRHPLYLHRYHEELAKMYLWGSPEVRAKIAATAAHNNTTKLLGRYLAKYRKANGMTSIPEAGSLTLDLFEMNQIAHQTALNHVKDLLYDLTRSSNIADATRAIFPFGDAWYEIVSRWARLMNPMISDAERVGKNWRRVEQGFQGSDGWFETNNQGEEVFTVQSNPLLAQLTKALSGSGESGIQVQPKLGLGQVMFINPTDMSQVIKPGTSPLFQMTSSVLIPWFGEKLGLDAKASDAIEDFVYGDFQPPDTSSLWSMIGTALPTQYRRVLTALFSEDRMKDLGDEMVDATNAIMASNDPKYFTDVDGYWTMTQEDALRVSTDARAFGGTLTLARVFDGWFMPGQPKYEIAVEVVRNAQDKDLSEYVSIASLTEEWSILMDFYDGDKMAAMQHFYEHIGVDPLNLTGGSRSTKDRPITTDAYQALRDNPAVGAHTDYTMMAFLPEENASEIDYSAYVAQFEEGTRQRLTPEMAVQVVSQSMGQMHYTALKNKRDDDLEMAAATYGKDSKQYKKYRDEYLSYYHSEVAKIDTAFFAWGEDYTIEGMSARPRYKNLMGEIFKIGNPATEANAALKQVNPELVGYYETISALWKYADDWALSVRPGAASWWRTGYVTDPSVQNPDNARAMREWFVRGLREAYMELDDPVAKSGARYLVDSIIMPLVTPTEDEKDLMESWYVYETVEPPPLLDRMIRDRDQAPPVTTVPEGGVVT